MKNIIICICIFLSTITLAQENARTVIDAWLNGYCDEGEEISTNQKLLNYKTEAQKVFIRILSEGVNSKLIEGVSDQAKKQYARRKEMIESGRIPNFDEEMLDSLKKESEDQFVKRKLQALQHRYEQQSIYGLWLIQTEQGNKFLKELSDRKDYKYQALIKRLEGRK